MEDHSTNGTFLNGVKIEKGKRVKVKNNDEIGIVVRAPADGEGDESVSKENNRLELGYIFRDSK